MALPRTTLTHGPKLPAVSGRALVTGASSGIGWACAEALRDAGFDVVGTSRKGADAYLGRPRVEGLQVVESIPPRRTGSGLLRRGIQVLDLVREHLQIRRLAAQAGPGAVVALDSSKYPFPTVLTPGRDQASVLFLHNVRPHHDDAGASLRLRLLRRLELGAATGCDRVIVHGRDQRSTAQQNLGEIRGDLIAVPLPTSTRIDEAATVESVPVPLHDDGPSASRPWSVWYTTPWTGRPCTIAVA